MINRKSILPTLGLILGLTGLAHAVPCDGVTVCERPSFDAGTQAGWSVSASGVSGIKALVSVGPTGNTVGSQYYFGVSNADLGATVASGGFTPGGSGARVISTAFATNASQTPGNTVFGGAVQQTLGGTAYFFYAQACPSASGIYNSAGCSAWTRIGNTSTLAYPVNVFSNPVAGTDSSINTISARKNVPAADVSNVSLLKLTVHDLITPANNQTLAAVGFGGANGSQVIDNSMYTQNGGFKPNVKYEYVGQVTYPFGTDVPTAGGNTRGPFWTTPADPSNVTVSNITHCSADITSRNTGGAIGNPSYTTYNLCAVGSGGSCSSAQIGGTGAPANTITRTITGLVPGTNYQPTAQALVGNNDGSQTGWDSSSVITGSPNPFTTDGTGGVFTITNVTTTSADFNFPGGFDVTGAVSWQRVINGVLSGAVVAGLPPATIAFTGLTPNTAYNVQIRVNEASCNYTVPPTALTFATDPIAPATGSFANVVATSLDVTWTDPSANPNGSTYEINLCTDAGFTAGCQTNTVNKPTMSTTFAVSPVQTYFARVRTRNVLRPTWPDSAYLVIGSVTTPPNQSNISISPNPANAITGVATPFTATVFDQTGSIVPGQAVNWSYSGGNGQISPLNGSGTTLTPTGVGPFVLTASLAGYPNATANVTVSAAGPFFTTSPDLTINVNQLTGNVSARGNDADVAIGGEAGISYTWTLESGPAPISVSPNGNHAARDAVVTFSRAGNYVLRCTLSDANGTGTPQMTPSRTVNQVLSGIAVCPAGAAGPCPTAITLKSLQEQQFEARLVDQFGFTMSTPPSVTWSATGGSVNSAGVFNGSQLGVTITITAQSGALSGAINVTLVSFDVSNAKAYPVPWKASQGRSTITFDNLGSEASIHIYTTSGRLVFETRVSAPTYDWNVANTSGESVASGVYFYVIESPEGKKNGKLIIIK